MISAMGGRAEASGITFIFRMSVVSSPEFGFGNSAINQLLKKGSIALKASSVSRSFAPIALGVSTRPRHWERME
jgi:hypothetical protein